MFTQMSRSWFTLVSVCPGANCVNVRVVGKHSPTLSGRKTPDPRPLSGVSVQVVGFTAPSMHRVSPPQPKAPAMLLKLGVVPTKVTRSTRLVLEHPLLSKRYSCAV